MHVLKREVVCGVQILAIKIAHMALLAWAFLLKIDALILVLPTLAMGGGDVKRTVRVCVREDGQAGIAA